MRSARWFARGAVISYLLAVVVVFGALAGGHWGGGLLVAGLMVLFLLVLLQAVVMTGPRRLLVGATALLLALGMAGALLAIDRPAAAAAVPLLAALGAALHLQWRSSRVLATLPDPPKGSTVDRRAVLVVNPRSGDGTAERVDLQERAEELGIEVLLLEEGDAPADLARRAAEDGAEVLGIAGGDGSLASVAEVAMEHDLPLVVVPAGTRNHLAQDLGLDRKDPLAALAAFTHGEERLVDVARVNDRAFLNNVSLGVYGALVDQEGYRDAKLSTLLEALPALWLEGGPWFDLCFDVPDHGTVEQAALLQVSNNAYALEGDLFRRDALDDGCLGMVTVDPDRLRDLVALTALTAVGRPGSSSALWSWSAAELLVTTQQELVVVGIDGERAELEAPLHFSVQPRALRVLVPEGTNVGLAEQAPESRAHVDLLTGALGLDGPDD